MPIYPTRRTLLASTIAASAASLLALPAAQASPAPQDPAMQDPALAEGAPPIQPGISVHSRQSFLAQDTFIIAHRGAGAVNPEHTAYAYSQAIRRGARAVEISVRTSKDGHLVCMHDETVDRVTGASGYVRKMTLAELKTLTVNMGGWLGSGTPAQSISTLDEALDAIAATPAGGSYASVGPAAVLFIEPKNPASYEKTLDLIVRRGLQGQVVLKMYRNGDGGYDPASPLLTRAKELGLATWCYFDKDDPYEGIAAMAASPNVDMLGAPYFELITGRTRPSMSDEQISQLVALGKPVIVWEIHRRSDLEHFRALGVRGFMSSDPYWVSGGQPSANMALPGGRRSHGMLPAGQQVVKNMPLLQDGAIIHQQNYDDSILLGPLATLAQRRTSYAMRFSLRWQERLPITSWQYGYIAFGRQTDAPFGLARKFMPGPASGGYVLAVRPGARAVDENGKRVQGDMVQLLRYDHGQATPVVLKTFFPSRPFAADQDIPVKIVVRPQSLVVEVAGARAEVLDATYRGPYTHFGRYHNNDTGGPLALHSVSAYAI